MPNSVYQDVAFLHKLARRDLQVYGEDCYYQAYEATEAAKIGIKLLKQQEAGTKQLLSLVASLLESGKQEEALGKLRKEISCREPTPSPTPTEFSKVKQEVLKQLE